MQPSGIKTRLRYPIAVKIDKKQGSHSQRAKVPDLARWSHLPRGASCFEEDTCLPESCPTLQYQPHAYSEYGHKCLTKDCAQHMHAFEDTAKIRSMWENLAVLDGDAYLRHKQALASLDCRQSSAPMSSPTFVAMLCTLRVREDVRQRKVAMRQPCLEGAA